MQADEDRRRSRADGFGTVIRTSLGAEDSLRQCRRAAYKSPSQVERAFVRSEDGRPACALSFTTVPSGRAHVFLVHAGVPRRIGTAWRAEAHAVR